MIGAIQSRLVVPERMDAPDVGAVELERSLADLRGVNRWLGGTRLMIRLTGPLLARAERSPVRLLDVATGSADVPVAIVRWCRSRGIGIRVTATDVHSTTVAAARTATERVEEIRVDRADALELPYDQGSFDVVTCATALHHFDDEKAVRVLRELARVSRLGVVVTDLRRSRAGLLGARVLAQTLWRGHILTRHDGPASVRAAFTRAELEALARAAAVTRPRVRTHALRVSLVAGASIS